MKVAPIKESITVKIKLSRAEAKVITSMYPNLPSPTVLSVATGGSVALCEEHLTLLKKLSAPVVKFLE